MNERHWRDWDMARNYDSSAWQVIDAGYTEPHRAYHGWAHIEDMLEKLEQNAELAVRADLIAHAIFWHDVVYLTQAADGSLRSDAQNVEDSANLFLRHALLSAPDAQAVWHMIMATAKHMNPDKVEGLYAAYTRDRDLFLDIDLASLAISDSAFDANTAKIRREYAWVAEEVFCRERAKILTAFAAVEPTYKTPELEERWGAKARANLHRSAVELAARADSLRNLQQ